MKVTEMLILEKPDCYRCATSWEILNKDCNSCCREYIENARKFYNKQKKDYINAQVSNVYEI